MLQQFIINKKPYIIFYFLSSYSINRCKLLKMGISCKREPLMVIANWLIFLSPANLNVT